jgi:hypothetical protein
MKTIVASFRMKPEEFAKALEGLLDNDIDPANLTTISNIVRTTFYYGLISFCEDPNAPVSEDIQKMANQIIGQNKRRVVKIKDLI